MTDYPGSPATVSSSSGLLWIPREMLRCVFPGAEPTEGILALGVAREPRHLRTYFGRTRDNDLDSFSIRAAMRK